MNTRPHHPGFGWLRTCHQILFVPRLRHQFHPSLAQPLTCHPDLPSKALDISLPPFASFSLLDAGHYRLPISAPRCRSFHGMGGRHRGCCRRRGTLLPPLSRDEQGGCPLGQTQIPHTGEGYTTCPSTWWLKLKEWGDKYGGTQGFYRTEMLGCKVLVTTDEKVAEDLLVRRAKYNSDRPLIRSLFDQKNLAQIPPLMGRTRVSCLPLPASSPCPSRCASPVYLTLTPQTSGPVNESSPTPTSPRLSLPTTTALCTSNPAVAGAPHHPPRRFPSLARRHGVQGLCTLTWDDPNISEYFTGSAWGLLRQMSPAGPSPTC